MITYYKIVLLLLISLSALALVRAQTETRATATTVLGWGSNLYGQLNTTDRTNPEMAVEIDFRGALDGKTIQDLASGLNHLVVLTTTNEVYTWGLGQFGVLGQGTEADSPVPLKIVGPTIAKIAAGKHFTVVLTTGGLLYGWGYNDNGQIKSPMGVHVLSPAPIDMTMIGGLTVSHVSIHPFGFHIAIMTTTGELFTWGWNMFGQLGDGSTSDRARPEQIFLDSPPEAASQVSAGFTHTMALSVSNKLYIWGANDNSRLGIVGGPLITVPTWVNTTGSALEGKAIAAIYCGSYSQYVFDSNGAIYGWGMGAFPQGAGGTFTIPVELPSLYQYNVSKIFTAYDSTYVFSNSTDMLLSWGADTYDQPSGTYLIKPVRNFEPLPSCPIVALGIMHHATAALTNCSRIMVWGDDLPTFGAKGPFALPQRAPVPSDFCSGSQGCAINAQTRVSAVRNNTAIYLWGHFAYLDEITPPSPNISTLTPPGESIRQISWGPISFLFFNRSNYILASGSDLMGQMGDVGRMDRPSPLPVFINDSLVIAGSKASNYSNFVWMETGELYVWGHNELLVLGVGNIYGADVPTLVSFSSAYPAGFAVVSVAPGSTFCVALSSEGQLASWGSKYHGTASGDVFTPQALLLPAGPHVVTKIAAGSAHAVVLTQAGKLFVWGDNSYGQLGDGSSAPRVTPTELIRTGSVIQGITVVEIACGPRRTYILDTRGHLFGWGTNQYGEISSMPDWIIITPVNMTADILAGFVVLNISAGDYHNLAIVYQVLSIPLAPASPPVGMPAASPIDAAPSAIAPSAAAPSVSPSATPSGPPTEIVITDGSNTGAIVGAVIGVAAVAIAATLVILLLRRRKRQNKARKAPKDVSESGGTTSASASELKPQLAPVYSADKLANSTESKSGESSGGATPSPDQTKPSESAPSSAPRQSHSATETSGEASDKEAIKFKPEWMIDYKDVHFQKQIGSGSFGTVFLGTYEGEECAIKQASFTVKPEALEDFKREAALILSIKPHPAIVQVLGIAQDKENIYVIMELCDRGSLDKLLEKNKLGPEEKLRLLGSAAAGIAHLHKHQVVHRDIAARNILLTFGMSRIVGKFENKGVTASTIGPIRWMSPESIAKREYSPASDVWMFGILCVEVWTEKPPHADLDNFEVAMKIRNEGFHPAVPDEMPQWLKDTCLQCWTVDPGLRPTMSEIVNRFHFHAAKDKS